MKVFIDGMMCDHCAHRVEKAISEINGVTMVHVNLEEKFADIQGSPSEIAMKEAIEKAGYHVSAVQL